MQLMCLNPLTPTLRHLQDTLEPIALLSAMGPEVASGGFSSSSLGSEGE